MISLLLNRSNPYSSYDTVFGFSRVSDPDTCIRLLTGITPCTPVSQFANSQALHMFQQRYRYLRMRNMCPCVYVV